MPFQPGQSGNPAGRPKGSCNRQLAMLRDAVDKVLPLVLQRALEGDEEAQKLILEKGLPKFRQIEFSFGDKATSTPQRNTYLQSILGNE